jgi:bleomycin hydrolase
MAGTRGRVPEQMLRLVYHSKQDILVNLTSRKAEIADTQVFNVKLSNEVTPVTSQKSSGRCWLFATTNVARLAFAKKYNVVSDCQLSQAYLFFWDHLEKVIVPSYDS